MTRSEQLRTSIIEGILDDVEWLIECTNAAIGMEHVQLAIDNQQQAVADLLKSYMEAPIAQAATTH